MRSLAGIGIGVVLGVGVVFAGDAVHLSLFPLPEGIDLTRPDQREALALAWPWTGFAAMVGLWGIAAFVASGVAGLIAARGPWSAWIAGAGMAAATGLNLILIHHPVWVWSATWATLVIGILAGAQLGGPRAAA